MTTTGNVRQTLPNRRLATTLEFDFDGMHFTATLGRHRPDAPPTELFLNNAYLGSVMDSIVHDAAIAVSFALQYGVTIAELRLAMTRDSEGRPLSPINYVLDLIDREEK